MLKLQSKANIPTEFGEFCFMAFSDSSEDYAPLIVAVAKGTDLTQVVNVRIHSECITGEVFHSKKCECGQQLAAAMQYVQEHGGLIVYLRQEGRGIGIINKLKAYSLQELGRDTIEANVELNLPVDGRDYSEAIEVLDILGATKINLLTNNPDKMDAIKNSNLQLVSRIPLEIKANETNALYLKVKKELLGHMLS